MPSEVTPLDGYRERPAAEALRGGKAGVSINRIHVLTGFRRSTIYRILDTRGDA